MMRSDLFQHELTKTSAVFGRKGDVQVVFHGEDAMTNGSVIYLPALALGVDIADDDQAVMRGYVDHEAGHIRHSDMPLVLRKYGEYAEQGRTLAKSLHNCLEDVWLERRVMRDYRGAVRNLMATTRAVNQRALDMFKADMEKFGPKLAEPTFIVPFALTWLGRRDYGGPECQELLDLLPGEVLAWLDDPIRDLDRCENSADVFEISEDLERRLKGDYTERTGKERETKGEGGGEADAPAPGEGDGGMPDDGDMPDEGMPVPADGDEPGDGEPGEGEASKPKPETKPGEAAAAGMLPEDMAEPEDVFEDFEVADAMKDTLDKHKATGGGASRYRPYSTLQDRWIDGSGSHGLEARMQMDPAQYDLLLSKMAGPVNLMRRSLERALLARQNRDWDFGKERGRLDARRFPAVLAGRTAVFKERLERAEVDTALSIVVDLSGSMSVARRNVTARDCVIALAEAVDRTGVAYEITGFNSPMGAMVPLAHRPADKKWSRVEALVGWRFKGFEHRLVQRKGQIVSLAQCIGGNNVDGEALMMAYVRLRARQEKRKVLMMLSDGMPEAASDWGSHHLAQHLRTVVQLIEGEGTQVMAVGIQHDGVKQFFKDYVVVQNVNELGTACVGSLGRMLLGDSRGVDRSHLIAGL